MLSKKIISILTVILLIGGSLNAQQFKYIGAAKCKACHMKPTTGDQYNKWAKGPHAKAMESLSSQASLDYAKKNGIADPTKEEKCLKCHSTFNAVDAKLRAGITAAEGVSCESCHGPGSVYRSPTIMKNQEQSIKNGLVIPDKNTCIKCHNPENPFHKEFDFVKYSAKIAHPDPTLK